MKNTFRNYKEGLDFWSWRRTKNSREIYFWSRYNNKQKWIKILTGRWSVLDTT